MSEEIRGEKGKGNIEIPEGYCPFLVDSHLVSMRKVYSRLAFMLVFR